MYLNIFNAEQKKYFMDLAYTLVCADNVITDEERLKLNSYAEELGHPIALDKLSIVDINSTIAKMGKMDEIKKRKLYFELIGLANADFDYGEAEQAFMNTVQKALCIEDKIAVRMQKTVVKLLQAYIEMNSLFKEK